MLFDKIYKEVAKKKFNQLNIQVMKKLVMILRKKKLNHYQNFISFFPIFYKDFKSTELWFLFLV